MIAVCDMGPLQYLVLIEAEHILPRLFDRLITARVVIEKEMDDPHTPSAVREWAANPPPWLEVLEPQQVEAIPALGQVGVRGDGDRAVIALAREVGADLVLMDDIKARREARVRGLEPLWLLQVLDEASECGLLTDLTEKLERSEQEIPFYVGEKARFAIEGMRWRELQRKAQNEQPAQDQAPSAPEQGEDLKQKKLREVEMTGMA